LIEWGSVDYVGNSETSKSTILIVDDLAPKTTMNRKNPSYGTNPLYVTKETQILLSHNNDHNGSGVALTWYKLNAMDYKIYTTPFIFPIGTKLIEWGSIDFLGNNESDNSMKIIMDDTSPTTKISFDGPMYEDNITYITPETFINFSSIDNESGVNSIFYKIVQTNDNDGNWILFKSAFNIPLDGEYFVYYYSLDNIGNAEEKKQLKIFVDSTPPQKPILNIIKTPTNQQEVTIYGYSEPNNLIVIYNNEWIVARVESDNYGNFNSPIVLSNEVNIINAIAIDNFSRKSKPSISQIVKFDNNNPTIIDVFPEKNSENISLFLKIEVIFNEMMNYSSAENAFSIIPSMKGEFKWINNSIIFEPYKNLSFNQNYIITINKTAKDLAGNHLDNIYIWTLSTEVDSDNDNYPNKIDVFPNNFNEWNDTDGDNYGDNNDLFPYNNTEWLDNDMDNIGDNFDSDDDNDGISDIDEEKIGSDPYLYDTDGDNYNDKDDDYPLDQERWKKEESNDSTIFIVVIIVIVIISIIIILVFLKIFKKRKGEQNSIENENIKKTEIDSKPSINLVPEKSMIHTIQDKTCTTCGFRMKYKHDNNKHFCDYCKKYE
jgi:hypothetical protein